MARGPPRQQRDRSCAYWRRFSLRAIASGTARPQARPCDVAGTTEVVEPCRLVVGKARGQDFAFPRAHRRLEPFKLRDDRLQRVRTLHARSGIDPLPGEQETNKVACRDWLDLRPQALDGVMVNAGKQAPLAPFRSARIGE